MDPDEVLKRAREALAQLRGAEEGRVAVEAGESFADAFEALDGWLSKGGFLPAFWKPRDSRRIVVEIECSGVDAPEVVNAVLDNGTFQDALNEYARDTGRQVRVRSAVMVRR
jgi:hypothetical protein